MKYKLLKFIYYINNILFCLFCVSLLISILMLIWIDVDDLSIKLLTTSLLFMCVFGPLGMELELYLRRNRR